MADGSKIEWTDASWNPLRVEHLGKFGWHCEHVSEGCRKCYAEGINRRLGTGLEFKPGHRDDLAFFLHEKTLLQPLHWRRPRKIFVGSMTDLFGDWVTDEQLDRIFAVMALCPQHTFQVLTKRPERMREYFQYPERLHLINGRIWSLLGTPKGSKIHHGGNWRVTIPLPNVWLGVSCEDQDMWNHRVFYLKTTPAAVHFVSAEPLLGAIDCGGDLASYSACANCAHAWIAGHCCDAPRRVTVPGIDWLICGGESGPRARPMHPDWARSLRDQCAAAGVAFFFKQSGEWASHPAPSIGHIHSYPETFVGGRGDSARLVVRIGKKAAGRLLDGVEHSAFPQCDKVRAAA